jgi:hypothetical protein
MKRDDSEKEKKELVFKASSQRDFDKPVEPGFRVNNVLRNARETSDQPSHLQSMKSTTIVNRAQLTPLKSETYEKARSEKQEMQFEAIEKKKVQKLNPIGGGGL